MALRVIRAENEDRQEMDLLNLVHIQRDSLGRDSTKDIFQAYREHLERRAKVETVDPARLAAARVGAGELALQKALLWARDPRNFPASNRAEEQFFAFLAILSLLDRGDRAAAGPILAEAGKALEELTG